MGEYRTQKTEKQWISFWEQLVRAILEHTTIDESETEQERRARIERLEATPEDWFSYYFPRYAYARPADFHKDATKRVIANSEWYEVRMWSRELAKSTRTMMEVLYLTLTGNKLDAMAAGAVNKTGKRYVLMVSNSLDNATRLLMPYKANLEFNRRIIRDYGPQEGSGNWQMAEFTTVTGVAYRAIGVGQSPRGARNEEIRPDVLIFDDVDTDADCLNPEIIAKKWHWIEEAAIGTRSISQPTTIIFCGNRIARDCCVERAREFADHVDEINIRDGEGKSTWPEKNSETDIDRVLRQKSFASIQKEYFNNPVSEGTVFKEISYKKMLPIKEYQILVCYTDPSYKATNDFKATVLVGKWHQEYHIIKCFLAQTTTADLINWHYQVMDLVAGAACYYYMEEVFMQDVIVREVSESGSKYGRTIPIRGDTRKKPDKFMRIESLLEPLNRNSQFYLNEDERENPHMKRLEEQFIHFAPGSRSHDDGPDAVEGAVWQIMERESKGIGEGIITFSRPMGQRRY